MNAYLQFFIYLTVLIGAIACCIHRFPQLDHATRFIGLFLVATALSESVAFYTAYRFGNNMPVYHVAAPVHFMIICLYFNAWIDMFRKKNIGIYIGIAGVLLAICNSLFVQSVYTLNSYFLLFEGACIISMALFAFYRILDNDQIRIMHYPHFWFSYIFLFFWSITYVNWAMYKLLGVKVTHAIPFIGTLLWVVNLITYLGLGLVVVFFPAKNKRA